MNRKMIKKGKKNKKNTDKDFFAIEDGKSFKEDENEFSYNNKKIFFYLIQVNFMIKIYYQKLK